MRKVLGIQHQLADNLNARLASGTHGFNYQGYVLDAMQNGLVCGFNNVLLLNTVSAAAAALAFTKVTTATVALTFPINTPNYYALQGLSAGFLRLSVSSENDGGVPATNGIFTASDSSSYPYARGVMRFQLGDVNGAATSLLDQAGDVWLPVGNKQDWEVHFGISNYANLSQAATVGFAEIGIAGGAVDDDPANDIATYFAQFKIAASTIVASTETTSLNGVALPAEQIDLGIRYDSSAGKFYFLLNGETFGGGDAGVAAHASMTGAQVFIRVSHLTAYAAATDAPLKLECDYVVANTMLME